MLVSRCTIREVKRSEIRDVQRVEMRNELHGSDWEKAKWCLARQTEKLLWHAFLLRSSFRKLHDGSAMGILDDVAQAVHCAMLPAPSSPVQDLLILVNVVLRGDVI